MASTVDEKTVFQDGNVKDNPSPVESGVLQDVYIDPKEEKKLLGKLDIFLVPIIMLVYLSCFLDRSNIGQFPQPATTSSDISLTNE